MISYNTNLYGKKLLENSCGEGNILCLAVQRYIDDAIGNGYSLKEIKAGLESDIYGFEIKKKTYNKCIKNLNKIAKQHNIFNINWNIIHGDALKIDLNIKFSFVIGNPPYISYQNLDRKTRKFIKSNYISCIQGKPDYCYAFIENAINYLDVNGKMVYLIPNSIFKNTFGKNLRKIIIPYVKKIYDYQSCRLFDNALTSSAIMLLEKSDNLSDVEYINIANKKNIIINKNYLGEKWSFITHKDFNANELVSFDQFFKASITIATQRNDTFVISKEEKKKYSIETGVLRKAISPRNRQNSKDEYIIFPYQVHNNKVYHYTEDKFQNKYPNTYKYLKDKKEDLLKRDMDKGAEWFEYGRSQAIPNMNKNKLLISTVITDHVNIYDIGKKTVPYSGIYIISDNGYDLNIAKDILKSKEFFNYIQHVGTPANGISLRISPNDVNKFKFRVGDFING